jgi:hypothetical protein
MGGGQYSFDVAREARATNARRRNGPFDYSGYRSDADADADAGAATPVSRVHPLLDVRGQIRECANQQAVVVALDVTRSRGDDARVVYDKLPTLIGWLELQGYLPGAAISFAAVGDADADQAPVQISQWERDNRLDEALSKVWLEEGGGGTGQESYELTAYFYTRHTRIRINEQGRKGYFFFIGDEGFYPQVSRRQVERYLGQKIPRDVPSQQIFQELQERFHVFLILPKQTFEQRKADIDAEIAQRVRAAGGQYDAVDVRISLIWNTRDDLDLHVIAPSGEEIWYNHKASACGGALDVDRNVRGETLKPVENVRWPKARAPAGEYQVFVQNYAYHEKSPAPVEYRLETEVNGRIQHFSGTLSNKLETGGPSNREVTRLRFDPAQRGSKAPASEDVYANYEDAVVRKQWAGVLPEGHILLLDDPQDIIAVIVGVVGLTERRTDLDGYLDALDSEGSTGEAQRRERRSKIARAVGDLALGALPVAGFTLGDLPEG